ncbi:MAG: hypothetical protein IJA20_02230 [Methanocorpusculum sp.]|nr:hypothetical protein [Oscillospiraceae bacterium]MBQ3569470.1 hypothetical protein [Methanocorpusculum sp.]
MSTKKSTLKKLEQFHPGDFVQLSDDILHDAFKGLHGRVLKVVKSRCIVAVACENGQQYDALPENVMIVMPATAAFAKCRLPWSANDDWSAYTVSFGAYDASVYQRFGDRRWVLSCSQLQIQQRPLPNGDLPSLRVAEEELRTAAMHQRDLANSALRDLGIGTGFRVDTRIGTMEASLIQNEELPGVSIDLHPFDGTPASNLLCLQQEDDCKLRATVYAELGSNPCDGSECGDYSHSICFTKPGESPDADIHPRWAVCSNKTSLYEAAAEYDYRMAREMIINRMVSGGYADPEKNYPEALEGAVSEYLKNRSFGCDEDYSLSEAMACLPSLDSTEQEG